MCDYDRSSRRVRRGLPRPPDRMVNRVRSIFLSDIHLGTRACQAERLLEFLREYESDHLFLVGDIIDFWAMSRGIHWTAAQNTVVQKILKRARHGVHVMFIPGNHDEAIREHAGISFGNILVVHEHVHAAADGKRYLLLHGDEFDTITRYHRWLAVLGDRAYAFVVRLNVTLSWIRRSLGVAGYWSLSGYAKRKVKRAVSFIDDFEESVVRNVKDRNLDGVICGHIHAPPSARSRASRTSTAATGWTAAPASSSTPTAAWKSCTGTWLNACVWVHGRGNPGSRGVDLEAAEAADAAAERAITSQ